jgi:predicted glycosyltransferase
MSPKNAKIIWIDLDNSPHVPFFSPIMNELKKRGYRVVFTARDCFQVCGLADLFNLKYKKIGRHYGKNKLMKVAGTLIRATELLPVALKQKPVLSVSHGSRSQFIASAILGIPHILIFDYEHANNLPFIKPVLGIAPEVIDNPALANAFSMGFRGYSGLKEDVYVTSFKPDPRVLATLRIAADRLVVTIRPPATEAHYHNPESERLFAETVERIGRFTDSVMVILPRNEKSQKQMIMDNWPQWCRERKIIIPEHVVNGLDLIWYSDFVVSGGGTMNREAASLGVPVFSIFRGKIGAVDKYLSEKGRLTLLQSVDDVRTKIKPLKRDKTDTASFKDLPALNQIVDAIDEIAAQFN